jgi:hypothetical protein
LTCRQWRLGLGPDDPEAVDVEIGERFRQVIDGHEQEMFDGSG